MTEVLNVNHSTLHVIAHASPGLLVVALAGELDLAGTDLLADLSGLDVEHACVVSLDLTGMEAIGATGVVTLLNLHGRYRGEGRELLLLYPPPAVQRTFAALGAQEYLTL